MIDINKYFDIQATFPKDVLFREILKSTDGSSKEGNKLRIQPYEIVRKNYTNKVNNKPYNLDVQKYVGYNSANTMFHIPTVTAVVVKSETTELFCKKSEDGLLSVYKQVLYSCGTWKMIDEKESKFVKTVESQDVMTSEDVEEYYVTDGDYYNVRYRYYKIDGVYVKCINDFEIVYESVDGDGKVVLNKHGGYYDVYTKNKSVSGNIERDGDVNFISRNLVYQAHGDFEEVSAQNGVVKQWYYVHYKDEDDEDVWVKTDDYGLFKGGKTMEDPTTDNDEEEYEDDFNYSDVDYVKFVSEDYPWLLRFTPYSTNVQLSWSKNKLSWSPLNSNSVRVEKNKPIYVRATMNKTHQSNEGYRLGTFAMEGLGTVETASGGVIEGCGTVNVSGDIRTLVNYKEPIDDACDLNFHSLFYGNDCLCDASGLKLNNPKGLFSFAYMFAQCGNLNKTPYTNEDWVIDDCGEDSCQGMFIGSGWELHAPKSISVRNNFGSYAFRFMFADSALIKMPKLPTKSVPNGGYNQMFYGCPLLTELASIDAESYGQYACAEMFRNCISIVSAPSMKPSLWNPFCFDGMFRGCSSLIHGGSFVCLDGIESVLYWCDQSNNSSTNGKEPSGYCLHNTFAFCPKIKDVTIDVPILTDRIAKGLLYNSASVSENKTDWIIYLNPNCLWSGDSKYVDVGCKEGSVIFDVKYSPPTVIPKTCKVEYIQGIEKTAFTDYRAYGMKYVSSDPYIAMWLFKYRMIMAAPSQVEGYEHTNEYRAYSFLGKAVRHEVDSEDNIIQTTVDFEFLHDLYLSMVSESMRTSFDLGPGTDYIYNGINYGPIWELSEPLEVHQATDETTGEVIPNLYYVEDTEILGERATGLRRYFSD